MLDLEDLSGRVLQIMTMVDNDTGYKMTQAFDIKTGDVFVISVGRIPACAIMEDSSE